MKRGVYLGWAVGLMLAMALATPIAPVISAFFTCGVMGLGPL